MTYENLANFLEMLRTHAVLTGPIRRSGDYMSISCVFSRWRHEKGTDSTPSMTISFGGDEASKVRCFACGYHGLFSDMVAEVSSLYQGRVHHLVSAILETEYTAPRPLTMVPKQKGLVLRNYNADLKAVGKALTPEASAFLASKGCPENFAKRMGVRWVDTMQAEKADGDTYEVRDAILIPVFSAVHGKVMCVGAQARELHPSPTMPKYVTAFRFPSGSYFYGDHLMSKMTGRDVFLTEGPLDAIHVMSVGEWALGLFGIALQKTKLEKLAKVLPNMVYILLDADKAGSEAANRVYNAAAIAGLPVRKLVPPKDPRQLTREDLLFLKGSAR